MIVGSFAAAGGTTTSVAYSDDGTDREPRPASAGQRGHRSDGPDLDLADLRTVDRPAPEGVVLTGHTNAVFTAQFSPDGQRVASASLDGTVRLWDLTDPVAPAALGEPLRLSAPTLVGESAVVTTLGYAPDGNSLAIAGSEHSVRVWDLDPQTLVQRICTTAANNLTEASWQQYFRDQPYQPPECG